MSKKLSRRDFARTSVAAGAAVAAVALPKTLFGETATVATAVPVKTADATTAAAAKGAAVARRRRRLHRQFRGVPRGRTRRARRHRPREPVRGALDDRRGHAEVVREPSPVRRGMEHSLELSLRLAARKPRLWCFSWDKEDVVVFVFLRELRVFVIPVAVSRLIAPAGCVKVNALWRQHEQETEPA